MPCRVQQEDGQQNCLWPPIIELRNNVESRCNPEHQRAENKIDGEDIHGSPRTPDAPAYSVGTMPWSDESVRQFRCRLSRANELRVFVPRSRRKNSVGP